MNKALATRDIDLTDSKTFTDARERNTMIAFSRTMKRSVTVDAQGCDDMLALAQEKLSLLRVRFDGRVFSKRWSEWCLPLRFGNLPREQTGHLNYTPDHVELALASDNQEYLIEKLRFARGK